MNSSFLFQPTDPEKEEPASPEKSEPVKNFSFLFGKKTTVCFQKEEPEAKLSKDPESVKPHFHYFFQF